MIAALVAIWSFLKGNWTWAIPLALLVGVSIDDGLHRLWLAECNLARAEDKTAAEKAKTAALEDAQKRSDAIITEQAQAIAARAGVVNTITERIIHVPVTTACASSPAMRAATGGLRELFNPGGGQAPAGGGAAPAVPGSRAGR